ncbi:MAG: hypothetical protein JXX28_07000 [Deltaproteobacteria bacterium]|nr:hypothetical protein [Deltaproteobacteria bacterium]
MTVFALALALMTSALAQDTVEVRTPLGQVIQAEVVKAPAAGTVEDSVLQSLKMIQAKEFDAWIATWCHESRCPVDPQAREEFKGYNLTAASRTAHECLQEGDALWVTNRKTDDRGATTVYLFCGEKRMPSPSTHIQVGERWQVSSFSW